jgi:hypothetical protein
MLHEAPELPPGNAKSQGTQKNILQVNDSLPQLLIWLIETWGSPRYRDDLLGDLIEQHRAGRSRAWCWRQAAGAFWLGRVEVFRASPWMAAVKALILAFGVITLGVSTLSWAESVHDDACKAASCAAEAFGAPGR